MWKKYAKWLFHCIDGIWELFAIVEQACDACDNAQQYDNYYNRYDNDILKMRWEMKKKQQQIASNIPNDWPVNRLVVHWGLRIGNT